MNINQINMAAFNGGNPALGNMPMPNNGPNGAIRLPEDHADETNYEGKLNSFIYNYFCDKGQFETARALKNSGLTFDPRITDTDVNGVEDNMQTDSKNGIDKNRPDDLPDIKGIDGQGGSFLLNWFNLFWDIYFAHRKGVKATANAMQYVQHTQQTARLRQDQQQRMFQGMGPMMNNNMENYQHMMRFQGGIPNDNLRQRALQNNRPGGMQPTPQQIAQIRNQQMLQQQQMGRRDPSEMDMNGQRPRTPSASDHAPSPSKRQRMDGVPFNGPQMMPNGRGPPQGMPPGMMGGDAALNANHLLMNNGINPGNLSDSQFASFQQQNPVVQQKSIQVYAQNLAKNQRQQSMSKAGGMSDQGSPIMDSGMGDLGPDFYGGGNPTAMQMRGGAPQNVPNGTAGGNHALQDYQMQLMLLEQQNKKRLLMARQEQDTIGGRPDGQPGMPGPQGFVPGMSPGSRGGPSPGPSETKRGSPKMNQVGLPGGGSPMPGGSPAASMNFNQMDPAMYAQMNGNRMQPPSSNPFPGQQFNPQHMEVMARAQAGRGMPNGWQQGPQGQPPMMGQPQPQQPAPMGTPQTRNNEMPPPQGVPGATANGRAPSPQAPPTPQTTNKANPKGKKEARDRKKPAKKSSVVSVAATPASEAETANPPTPTPATPSTPQHANSFAGPKTEGQGQANMMPGMANGSVEQIPPPQPDPNAMQYGLEGADDQYNPMPFNNDLSNPDLLDNFDFEQFLQSTDGGDFNFDPAAFESAEGIEAGIGN